jgi:hypothetical protein
MDKVKEFLDIIQNTDRSGKAGAELGGFMGSQVIPNVLVLPVSL